MAFDEPIQVEYITRTEEMAQRIKQETAEEFRTSKFIKDTPQSKDEHCYRILDRIAEELTKYKIPHDPDRNSASTKTTTNRRKAWVDTYKNDCLKELNSLRTYRQDQLKAKMTQVLRHRKKLYPPNLMKNCLTREVRLQNKEDLEAFADYWTKFLPTVAGLNHWGASLHLYGTISDACLPGNDNRKCVPPSTEALCVTMYENVFDRVIGQEKFRQDHPGQRLPVPKKKNNGVDDPFPAKYTTSLGGQTQLGGWYSKPGMPGIARFAKLKKACVEARKTEKGKRLELELYEKLRKEHNITKDSREDERAHRRKLKNGGAEDDGNAGQVPDFDWNNMDDDEEY